MKKLSILYILLGIVATIVIIILMYNIFNKKFLVEKFNSVIEVNYGDEFKQDSSVCYGNKIKCEKVTPSIIGEVDTEKLGVYKVTYKYKKNKKILKKVQIVKVVDKIPPTLEIEDTEFLYCPNGNIPDYKVTSIDNYDGDISIKVLKTIKDNKIVFSIKDSSGNETVISKDAKKQDYTKPTLNLKGNKVIYIKENDTYNDPGYEAYDNCEGDITFKVKVDGTVDTKIPGEYIINYKVSDTQNNETTAKRVIYVYKNVNSNTQNGKIIYLTFDDGPSKYTSKLLDILKKYNVKATFFVTGVGYDNIILREYNEGHTIGLHSNTHNYSIYSSAEEYFKDLYAIQEKVKSITGYTSFIIRFPGGSSNTVSRKYDNGTHIMSYLTKKVEQEGFKYFDWNVSGNDTGGTTATNVVINNVIKDLNRSENIVLMHDTKSYSVDAVESIIQYGLSHGYSFKAIDMTTIPIHHSVNN